MADGSAVVEAHVAAFNAQDIDALMAGFCDDASWVTGTDVVPTSELRAFFTAAFEHLTPRLSVERVIDGGDAVAAQMRETWSHEGESRSASIIGVYDVSAGLIRRGKIYREGSADA
ncbi:nuclear transport factor 2 family protein [Luteipulveratus halotolerans]|uniref:SnoaL-like domain-containing protein n=1 Tax=Luteipulveratus halotolerans TaxID=1631356 RepID=A0A0L6CJL7_9MICO|nr:nuclear transport factor 2 family protein [Luteipulveratus halotolerans]KNX37977.1 hypothetical protein VV01_13750 [Luteipulveratus halotolerans]